MSDLLNTFGAVVAVLGGPILVLVTALAVTLVVFLVIRWFWLWYWRVDEQVRLLKHMAASLQRLEEQGRPLPPGSPAARRQAAPAPTP